MTLHLFALVSFAAMVAASVPPLYFALRLRSSDPRSARLSALLAGAFLSHAAFHLLDGVEADPLAVQVAGAVSGVLLLAFALSYWPLRRRRDR